jgi:hypothetical protein
MKNKLIFMALKNHRQIKCLNCGTQMNFLRKLNLRNNVFQVPSIIPIVGIEAGEKSLIVDIFICFKCGKIDFYGPDETDETSQLKIVYGTTIPKGTMLKCNKCGKPIIAGSKKCPFCGEDQPYTK